MGGWAERTPGNAGIWCLGGASRPAPFKRKAAAPTAAMPPTLLTKHDVFQALQLRAQADKARLR